MLRHAVLIVCAFWCYACPDILPDTFKDGLSFDPTRALGIVVSKKLNSFTESRDYPQFPSSETEKEDSYYCFEILLRTDDSSGIKEICVLNTNPIAGLEVGQILPIRPLIAGSEFLKLKGVVVDAVSDPQRQLYFAVVRTSENLFETYYLTMGDFYRYVKKGMELPLTSPQKVL